MLAEAGKHGLERGGDHRGQDGGREPERERGGLRDKQVLRISRLCSGAAEGCGTVRWLST